MKLKRLLCKQENSKTIEKKSRQDWHPGGKGSIQFKISR